MKNDILKTLALRAKNRLIHKTDSEGSAPLKNDFRIKIIKSGDQVFYDRVKDLLARDEDVCNPIKELMDERLYSTMSAGEKEKYVLETAEKFARVRSMIEGEKELKVVY